MKIGIFGDSYASVNMQDEISWINVLCKMLKDDSQNTLIKDIKVENYAKGGSSLYFSYKNFLRTKDQYDIIIFAVTEPHRYPVSFVPKHNKENVHYISNHFNTTQILDHYKNLISEDEINFLHNVQGWFNASNEKYNEDIHELILNDIESKHNNVILYPCFINSYNFQRFERNNLDPMKHPFHSFWLKQCKLLNIDSSNFTALEKTTLQAHLTPELNEFVAKLFFRKLKTGNWDFTGFEDIKIKMPKTYYYANWD